MSTLSVVIPAFNAAATLPRAIESCLSQVSRPEVIVVDDGSTDETRALSESLDGEVRWLCQRNSGCRIARNLGARTATGEWVAFLDADDALLPNWSTVLQGLLAREEGLRFLSAGTQIVDVNTRDSKLELPRTLGPAFENMTASFLPGAYAVNRELFLDVGGFWDAMRFWEHHELGVRLGSQVRSRHGYSLDPIVQKYNDRSQSVTDSYLSAKADSALAFSCRYRGAQDRISSMLGAYCSVGARSAALVGRYADARTLYRRSIFMGRRPQNLSRLAVAHVPGLRERFWPVVQSKAAG